RRYRGSSRSIKCIDVCCLLAALAKHSTALAISLDRERSKVCRFLDQAATGRRDHSKPRADSADLVRAGAYAPWRRRRHTCGGEFSWLADFCNQCCCCGLVLKEQRSKAFRKYCRSFAVRYQLLDRL